MRWFKQVLNLRTWINTIYFPQHNEWNCNEEHIGHYWSFVYFVQEILCRDYTLAMHKIDVFPCIVFSSSSWLSFRTASQTTRKIARHSHTWMEKMDTILQLKWMIYPLKIFLRCSYPFLTPYQTINPFAWRLSGRGFLNK